MKAFVVKKYGKKEKLHLDEVIAPVIKEHEVLVEIYAAGVNQLDTKILSGEFKLILPYKLPFVLGHDLAGVVTQVGSKVTKFKLGDEVISRPSDHHIGTFAEYLPVSENDLAPKPQNLSMEDAAGIPLVALTAWQALVEIAQVKKGQKVFVQAGSGGVGVIAIQVAKHLGALVATTASEKSFSLLKGLGADVLIDYKTQDFEKELKDYDVVLNSQDTKTLKKSLNILKPRGKAISISGPPTPDFGREIGASWLIRLVLSIISLAVRKKAKKKNIDYHFLFMKSSGKQLTALVQLIKNGVIKTVTDKVYSFAETNKALEHVASGRAKGKVIIKLK